MRHPSSWKRILSVGCVSAMAVLCFAQPAGAVPPLAQITLDKTVMIDNGNDECGTATALTVGLGTTVRYCYTATNTGNVTLDTHSLVDDQLGTILSDFAVTLDPDTSVFMTQTAVARETVTNTATWTAGNNQFEIFGIEATDSLTVTVTPPSITLDKTVTVDTGSDECGTETAVTVGVGTMVRYCYTVTNTGLTTLTEHSLVDDQLGTILSDFVFTLDPGASTSITQTAVITEAITNVATWTAENNSLEVYGVIATDELSVTIEVAATTPPAVLPPTGPVSPLSWLALLGLTAIGLGVLALTRSRPRSTS